MISRETGKTITEDEHIIQSMLDIALTAKGTRVMRRNYGTILVPKIDAPMNDEYRMMLMSSLMIAFAEFEPRVEVRFINVNIETAGKPSFMIEAVKKRSNEALNFTQNFNQIFVGGSNAI